MILYDFTQYENVIICGDIHGHLEVIYRNPFAENTLFVVAGDCGFGFCETNYYHYLYNSKMNRCLGKKGNTVLFLRGNHDDPTYFDGSSFSKKRAICIPDYSIVKTAHHHILCIGGAVSVDRTWRQEQMKYKPQPLYWKNEHPVYYPEKITEISQAGIAVDTVITHTCPTFCPPFTKSGIENWLLLDENLSDDIETERALMDKIWYELKSQHHPVRQWWYGHFHRSAWLEYEGCYFRLLDENEMDYLKNN